MSRAFDARAPHLFEVSAVVCRRFNQAVLEPQPAELQRREHFHCTRPRFDRIARCVRFLPRTSVRACARCSVSSCVCFCTLRARSAHNARKPERAHLCPVLYSTWNPSLQGGVEVPLAQRAVLARRAVLAQPGAVVWLFSSRMCSPLPCGAQCTHLMRSSMSPFLSGYHTAS